MNLNKYQEISKDKLPAHENPIELKHALSNYSLGLSYVSGKVSGHIQEHFYKLHELDKEKIKDELGNILHYLSGLATFCGFTLNEIAQSNMEKLNRTNK